MEPGIHIIQRTIHRRYRVPSAPRQSSVFPIYYKETELAAKKHNNKTQTEVEELFIYHHYT